MELINSGKDSKDIEGLVFKKADDFHVHLLIIQLFQNPNLNLPFLV